MTSRRTPMPVSRLLEGDFSGFNFEAAESRPRRTSSAVANAGSDDSVIFPSLELPGRGMASTMHTVEEEEYGDVASGELAPASDGKAAPPVESGEPKDIHRGSATSQVAKGKEVCSPEFKGDDLNLANSGSRSAGDHQGNARCQFKRSVSFADPPSPKSTAAHTRSLSSAFSGPSADRPVYLIPPRMRGPTFSQEFEDFMHTLPMPPTDHVTPGGSRRSSNSRDRTISVLSESPQSLWSKVRSKLAKPFRGCFGAE